MCGCESRPPCPRPLPTKHRRQDPHPRGPVDVWLLSQLVLMVDGYKNNGKEWGKNNGEGEGGGASLTANTTKYLVNPSRFNPLTAPFFSLIFYAVASSYFYERMPDDTRRKIYL